MRSSSRPPSSGGPAGRNAERIRVAQVVAFGAIVPLLVRLPPSVLARLLDRLARRRRDEADAPEVAAVCARIDRALAAGGRLVRPTCLTRGLTRYIFLRRAGLDVGLAFGLGRPHGDYAGHCWLELDGEPYLESADPRNGFVELFRLPAAQGS